VASFASVVQRSAGTAALSSGVHGTMGSRPVSPGSLEAPHPSPKTTAVPDKKKNEQRFMGSTLIQRVPLD